MSHTVYEPETIDNDTGGVRWMLTIYNNDINTLDEVIDVLMEATGCDLEEASIETWEAHHFGKAAVHFGAKDVCEVAGAIISAIGVKTEVTLEWPE